MTALIDKIENVFQNIPKGDIGIREAQASDSFPLNGTKQSYEDLCLRARAMDIEENWQDIPDEVISDSSSAFCFMDDLSFRFIIPAIMRFELQSPLAGRNDVVDSFVMKLIPSSRNGENEHPRSLAQKWLLTKEQIVVITEWLEQYFSELTCNDIEKSQLENWKKLSSLR